jgi:hypothetical protein
MTVNRTREIVSEEVSTVEFEDLTIDQAITELETIKKAYGGDAKIELRRYSYSEDTYFGVMAQIPETDTQMNARIAKEERLVKLVEQDQRKVYEQLKTKFEDK